MLKHWTLSVEAWETGLNSRHSDRLAYRVWTVFLWLYLPSSRARARARVCVLAILNPTGYGKTI